MSKELWTQYYKDVLLHILEDQRKEAVSFSFIMWGIAIICAGLLFASYYVKKRNSETKHKPIHKKEKRKGKSATEKLTLREKYQIYSLILALFFVVCQVFIVIGYQNTSAKINSDIESEAFAEYSGTYSVKYKKKWYHTDNLERTALISFSDDFISASYDCKIYDIYNTNGFYSNHSPIDRGIYSGKVIYAENSGYAVYWEK